jgi:hypothetical protein
MESIRQALLSERSSGKVRPEKIYGILIDLLDALQTQSPVEVRHESPVEPQVPKPELVPEAPAPVAQEPEAAPGPKMFGRSA